MAYEFLRLTIEHEGGQMVVESRRSTDDLKLYSTGITEPLSIPLLKSQACEPRYRFLEKERDFYRQQEAVNASHPVLGSIERLPTPMFLDLERRRQSGTRPVREGWREPDRVAPANPLAGSLLDSLRDAEDLAERTYRHFSALRTRLADDLKQEIILSAFALSTELNPSFSQQRSLLKEIERNERTIYESLPQIGISPESMEQTAGAFFQFARDVADRFPSPKRLRERVDENLIKDMQDWSAVQPTLRQISRFAGLITAYNAQVRSAYEPLDRYLNSVRSLVPIETLSSSCRNSDCRRCAVTRDRRVKGRSREAI